MKTNKKVMLTLDQELYYKVKRKADNKHVPVATYVKLLLAQMEEE